MTDPTEPPRSDEDLAETQDERADALASAYIDGELSEDERAAVEDDDDLADRVGAFIEVSRRVGSAPEPPSGALDAARAAALAAFDDQAMSDEESVAGASVVSLADRRPWWRRVPVGAAAAAVALVALVGVATFVGGDDGGDTVATSTFDAAEEGVDRSAGSVGDDSADMEAAEMDEAMDAADASDAPSVAADLGSGESTAERLRFSSPDTLRDYLVDQLAAGRADGDTSGDDGASDDGGDGEAPPAVENPDPCDAVATAGLDPEAVVTVVPIELDGRAATAVVHGPADRERLVVVDDESCDVVVDEPLR